MEQAILFLIEKDAIFEKLHQKFGNPFIPSRPQGFVTLCKLILEQQVSLESAKACFQKVECFLKEVTPQNIAKATEEELRNCSVSRQKTIYLKALSNAVLEGMDLHSLSDKSPDQVRKELIQIKGIGHWTIDVYLMFSLQSPDIIPLGDIAIINTIKELYNCSTKDEIEKITQNWKPYRTVAAFFLWHYYLNKRGRKAVL